MAKYVIALVVALLLNASANLMIKFGMRAIDLELQGAGILSDGVFGVVKLLLRHWILLVGLGCFAANVVFYSFALQKLPISVAYPIMVSGSLILIVLAAAWLPVLRERIVLTQLGGMLLIAAGVWLVSRPA